jgi:hypothetical protein
VPLTTDELVRPLGILYRRGKELGVTVRRFIELLRTDAKSGKDIRNTKQDKEPETAAESNGHERHEVLVTG